MTTSTMTINNYITEGLTWTHAIGKTMIIGYLALYVPIWVMARATFGA